MEQEGPETSTDPPQKPLEVVPHTCVGHAHTDRLLPRPCPPGALGEEAS